MSGDVVRTEISLSRLSIQDPKLIVSCIDFRYITDVLTEEEALGETCSCLDFRKGNDMFMIEVLSNQQTSFASVFYSDLLLKAQENKQQRGEHTEELNRILLN